MREEILHPYDRHVGRYGSQLAAELIEIAALSPGDRVLDVGCGTGQLTQALAAKVGSVNVSAVDPSPDVVEVCRARVPGGDVRVASAEDLPFEAAKFDAVLAQLVVNLVDDPPRAVAEMARVARQGATVAACVWDDDEMPLLRYFWDAAQEAAPDELAEVNDQAQVGLTDLGLLRDWWEGAGLSDVSLTSFLVAADYLSFDDLWFSFFGSHSRRVSVIPAPCTHRCQPSDDPESEPRLTVGWAHRIVPSACRPKPISCAERSS